MFYMAKVIKAPIIFIDLEEGKDTYKGLVIANFQSGINVIKIRDHIIQCFNVYNRFSKKLSNRFKDFSDRFPFQIGSHLPPLPKPNYVRFIYHTGPKGYVRWDYYNNRILTTTLRIDGTNAELPKMIDKNFTHYNEERDYFNNKLKQLEEYAVHTDNRVSLIASPTFQTLKNAVNKQAKRSKS
jgi:hypothetical protein